MKSLWQTAARVANEIIAESKSQVMVAIGTMLVAIGQQWIDQYSKVVMGSSPDSDEDTERAVVEVSNLIEKLGGTVPQNAGGSAILILQQLLPILLELLLKKKAQTEAELAA